MLSEGGYSTGDVKLFRLEKTGGYYALRKKGNKQFRQSLKTKDRKTTIRRDGSPSPLRLTLVRRRIAPCTTRARDTGRSPLPANNGATAMRRGSAVETIARKNPGVVSKDRDDQARGLDFPK